MKKNLLTPKLRKYYINDYQQMSLFVIFLYYMSQPYMFRASISPSSGVSLAVVTCCHLVHAVLGVCPRASGSFDVVTVVY